MQRHQSPEPVERFRPTGGHVVGYLTLAAIAGLLVYLLFADRSVSGLRIGTGAVFFGVLTWVTGLRPRVTAYPEHLHVLNSVRDVVIPLVAVDRVEVSRVLTIWVGERRYVCTGIGAAPRKLASSAMGQPPPDSHKDAARYVAFVRERINGLAREARQRAGAGAGAGGGDGAGTSEVGPRPVWAWPPLLALVGTGAVFVLSLNL